MVFLLQGSQHQQRLIQEALDRIDYPFDRLRTKLVRTTGGRDYIPVEWADLSRYGAAAVANRAAADWDPHQHDHEHGHDDTLFHAHGEENGDHWHAIGLRRQVLGLAWYSGKVSMDLSLESRPALAQEVFASEGAHMVDFFDDAFTDDARRRIFNAFHGDPDFDPTDHGHDWFDRGSYWDFVGEAFMGGFIRAYAPDIPVTIPFTHEATPQVGRWIREILTPELVEPLPPNTEPEKPEPPPGREDYVFGLRDSDVFHDTHHGVEAQVTWSDARAALTSGRRPCRTCDPWKNPAVWPGDLEAPTDV